MVNDFKPFKGAMAKLSPNQKGIERVDAETGRRYIEDIDIAVSRSTKLVDKSYEIYLPLYQAVSGREEERNVCCQFSRNFFVRVPLHEDFLGDSSEIEEGPDRGLYEGPQPSHASLIAEVRWTRTLAQNISNSPNYRGAVELSRCSRTPGERQMSVQSTGRIESGRIEPIVRMTGESARQKRVLCATDLSSRSQHAVARAARLAKQLDAQLIVLHVIDPGRSGTDSMHARDQIARQVSAVGVATRRESQIRIGTGNYVQGVAAVAREADADIIVLGAQRPGSLTSLIGTSAERITTLAGRPALIVNQESHRRYDTVVIAAELSDAFVQVVRAASSLMFLEAERVSIVHRVEFPRGALFAFDTRAAHRNLEACQRTAKARVLRHLDAAGVESSRFRFIFQQGPLSRAIRSVIRIGKAGLLIIGAEDRPILTRAIWGSVANDALRNIECDILVAAPKVEPVAGIVNQEIASQRIDLTPPELRLP